MKVEHPWKLRIHGNPRFTGQPNAPIDKSNGTQTFIDRLMWNPVTLLIFQKLNLCSQYSIYLIITTMPCSQFVWYTVNYQEFIHLACFDLIQCIL